MRESNSGFLLIVAFGAGITVAGVLSLIRDSNIDRRWKLDTAEHGCAEFDSHTGEWKWRSRDGTAFYH